MPIEPNPHVDPDRLVKLNEAIGGDKAKARRGSPKQTKRRAAATLQMARPPPGDLDAFDIEGFCLRHSISVPFYYKLKSQGLGPRETRLNSKVLITRESAADWRRAQEARTAAARAAE